MYIQNNAALREMLLAECWFNSCSRKFQDALCTMGEIHHFAKGESIYSSGPEDGLGFFCILEGSVCICKKSEKGITSILAFLEPYHWFGELPMIDGNGRNHHALAEKDATVLIIPKQRLLQWLTDNPENWLSIAKLCAYKLRVAYEFLDYTSSTIQYVARRLVFLSHGSGFHFRQPKNYIEISQKNLGLVLNLSRISINRALSKLEECGAIRCQYGGIKILSIDILRNISESIDSELPEQNIKQINPVQ